MKKNLKIIFFYTKVNKAMRSTALIKVKKGVYWVKTTKVYKIQYKILKRKLVTILWILFNKLI